MSFSPNIVGFACQWCTYAGADLAGNLRCKYPPTIKLIRVPCSGRVEPAFIIETLARGADGVFVGGCHFGDCHYKEGNYKADARFKMTASILSEIGFEPERFRWEWISGAEGRRFAEVMEEYTATLEKLGPNPFKVAPQETVEGAEQKGWRKWFGLNAASKDTVEGSIRLSLDGKDVQAPAGMTVAELLTREQAEPRLPRRIAELDLICNTDCPAFKSVDIDGRVTPLKLAAGILVREGMQVSTASEALTKKINERLDWLEQKGNCRMIQQIQEIVACEAQNSGLITLEERAAWKLEPWTSSPSIFYDPDLCIRCNNCVDTCNSIQEVQALEFDENKGVIMVDDGKCVRCGQCIHACPMGRESDEVKAFKRSFGCELCTFSSPLGSIREVDEVGKVIAALRDPDKFVVVEFAPSIRSSIGEEFGLPQGELVTGRLYAALKKAGFDRVWDTNYTADLTILEEGTELILRLVKAGVLPLEGLPVKVPDGALDHVESALPQFTSCSPGWVKFCETIYPDLIPHVSSAKSPQQMFGAVAKTYAAKKLGIDPEKVFVVSIMPCTAKKYECAREEMKDAEAYWHKAEGKTGVSRDVDVVLTTREAGRLLKAMGVDLRAMPEADADPLIGDYTGAATIFGRTGGVMEAALRTAYELLTGQALPNLEFHDLGTMDGIKRATVAIGDKKVNVAVAHGLKNCRQVCDSIREGGEFTGYQFIEFMCCPGGCIGGGGQPIPTHMAARKARTEGLNLDDREQALRKSHENREVLEIYKDFLEEPVSHLAHHLLHTKYVDRSADKKT